MLKIKDNVDLKELEKFGFEYNDIIREYYLSLEYCENIALTSYERKIKIESSYSGKASLVLFDLIQAGLVEKVQN